MIEQIVRWSFSITAFLLFGSLWEQLFPNRRDQKYIRFFWGLVFILIVIKPVAEWFQADAIFDDYVKIFASVWNEDAGVMVEQEEAEMQIEQAMLDAYEERVEREIAALAGTEGYILSDIRIECERDPSSAQYGQLLRIEGRASLEIAEDSALVSAIQIPEVRIGASETTEQARLEELSDRIAAQYQMEEQQVQIWGEAGE